MRETPHKQTPSPGFLILAAGLAKRFGANKLLADLPGTASCVIENTIQQLPAGYPCHVVCRPSQERVIALLEQHDIPYSGDESLSQGMGYSIAHGVHHTRHWKGWVICLADMPWIQTKTYLGIINALTSNRIVLPFYKDNDQCIQGNPVAFDHCFYPDLLKLSGSKGGREILKRHDDKISRLVLSDRGIILDIDHPDDINKHSQI